MVNVSRETDEFIKIELKKYNISLDKIKKIKEFVDILTKKNRIHQFVSKKDLPKIWNRHIYDSIQIMFHVKHYQLDQMTDIGSGAGFPGLVLAIINPSIKINLVERKQKRCNFLELLTKRLDLNNINLFCCNAQEIEGKFSDIVLRAVGNPKIMNKIIKSLVINDGRVFLYQNSIDNLLGLKMDIIHEYILPGETIHRYIVSYCKSR